jgi:hypothetical protein
MAFFVVFIRITPVRIFGLLGLSEWESVKSGETYRELSGGSRSQVTGQKVNANPNCD